MLAVEPGSTPVGPATLLSVLPPEGLDPGPDGFAVEAIGSDGTVVPLPRIRRFDSDWAEKFAFRDPVRLAEGAAIRVSSRSHPGPDSHAGHGHRRGAVGGGSSSPPRACSHHAKRLASLGSEGCQWVLARCLPRLRSTSSSSPPSRLRRRFRGCLSTRRSKRLPDPRRRRCILGRIALPLLPRGPYSLFLEFDRLHNHVYSFNDR